MYNPKHFKIVDEQSIYEFIHQHPLGTVISLRAGEMEAEHIPLLLNKSSTSKRILQGHIAKANALWKECNAGAQVLAIFQGVDAYISPNWYPSKQQHGKVVPTWNYSAVHVKGKIQFIHDASWKLQFLKQITNVHETMQASPWSVDDAPADYLQKLLNAIVGVEIEITETVGKAKLSQNKSEMDFYGAVAGLKQMASPQADVLAAQMEQLTNS
mgnify:CR=1 FL=1